MDADVPPWAILHARASALATDRRAAFALACAEHLVRLASTKPDLLVKIADGWPVLAGDMRDLSDHLVELDTRSDGDEDDVACVAYALETVVRPHSSASVLWAMGRAVDAAYERVPYPEGAISFRRLSADTMDPAVQKELARQANTLTVAEDVIDFADACQQLRARSI